MARTSVEVLQAILADPKNIDSLFRLTSPDVTYVSLNYTNSDLKRAMPWCGTEQGPEVIMKTFVDVGRYWSIEAFEPRAVFGDGEHAAMFGSFTYRATVLGKQVISPFSVYARVLDGRCTYLKFMEDTLATTESFRKGGKWAIHSDPEGSEITI